MDLGSIRAVLCDMDGTLVDSDDSVDRAWVKWAHRYGVEPDAALAIAHGAPADVTVRRLRPDFADEQVANAASDQLRMQYEDLGDVIPTPGALRLVEVLDRRRLPWAIVTSADRRLAAVRLRRVGISPPVLVTVEDVTAGKPDPEGYLNAAAILGVSPQHCLVVEDTEVGLQAGRSAGARTAGVKGLGGDLQLSNAGELADLFAATPPKPAEGGVDL